MSVVLLVLAHPRSGSLTAQVAARLRARLLAEGYGVDFLDLYAEDFDPRMRPEDEPDWDDPDKPYPPEIQGHMRRIGNADHILAVFPVWWSSPPAILRGWIERTWTHGFAYTPIGSNLTVRSMMWVGLAGTSMRDFVSAGLDGLLDRQLRVEVSTFCRIPNSRVRLIYETVYAWDPKVREVIWKSVDAIADEFIGLDPRS